MYYTGIKTIIRYNYKMYNISYYKNIN